MARLDIAVTDVLLAGVVWTNTSLGISTEFMFSNDGRTFLYYFNNDVGTRTVTLKAASTYHGLSMVNPTVSIAAGVGKVIGPFLTDVFNQPDGRVYFDLTGGYSNQQVFIGRLPA